jgi:hypothetical protein
MAKAVLHYVRRLDLIGRPRGAAAGEFRSHDRYRLQRRDLRWFHDGDKTQDHRGAISTP